MKIYYQETYEDSTKIFLYKFKINVLILILISAFESIDFIL